MAAEFEITQHQFRVTADRRLGQDRAVLDQRWLRADQRVASDPTTGSTDGWMMAAGFALASAFTSVFTAAMSRSARGAQIAAGPAITGSTAAVPAWTKADWLRTN